MTRPDPFQSRRTLQTAAGEVTLHDLHAVERAGAGKLARLPYSIRVVLESALRNLDNLSLIHISEPTRPY